MAENVCKHRYDTQNCPNILTVNLPARCSYLHIQCFHRQPEPVQNHTQYDGKVKNTMHISALWKAHVVLLGRLVWCLALLAKFIFGYELKPTNIQEDFLARTVLLEGHNKVDTCDRITICFPLNLAMEYRAFVNNFNWQNKATNQQS